jgi:polyisoprenyl-teichoic acid--peptidoglycan teichoic acid transferase
VAAAGSVSGFLIYEVGRVHRIVVPNLTKVPSSGIENILLVGSTNRCAVTSAVLKAFEKECADGVDGINSDVIMVLHLDPTTHKAAILSIPRDTFVPDARPNGFYGCNDPGGCSNKVDSALAAGATQLVATIQNDFGIPINHYVVLSFQTFYSIVTTLGGMSMHFPTAFQDLEENPPLNVRAGACVHISGLEALALVRSRHMYYDYSRKLHRFLHYDGSGDLGRITRVHEFLKALGKEVQTKGLGNPITDASLLDSVAPDLTVDFSPSQMLTLAREFHAVDVGSIPEYTLPVLVDPNTYDYEGSSAYGLVVFPSEPQDQATIDAFLGSTSPKPAPATSVSVSVSDGTGGTTGAPTAAALRARGFSILGTSTTPSVGPISETVVTYRTGQLSAGEAVLRAMSGAAVLTEGSTVGGADVTVTTGSDLAIAGAETVAHQDSGAPSYVLTSAITPTSAVLEALSSALGTPTSAQTAIPWYDPRPCK